MLLELGVLQDIGQDIKRPGHVLPHDPCVVRGLLPRGVRVQMSTHVLDLLLQCPCSPLLRALEYHVLEKVRGAVGLLSLEPRPGVDPHTDGGGAGRQVRLRGDTETVGEGGHAGLRGGEDPGVVGVSRVRRPVLEKPRVRVVELLDLGFNGLREAVVDHDVWGRRRRGWS